MAGKYDSDGWMLTDENELIAVARDASYKEAVRHGKTMISLLVAEIAPPPISYFPNYPQKDPMTKETHGPSEHITNPRKGVNKSVRSSTRRNRICKLLSRKKKHHPKYSYQRFPPLLEKETELTEDKPPMVCDRVNVSSLRIRIPEVTEDQDHEEWLYEEYVWEQMQRDDYIYDRFRD